jgi:hypothetical protein
MKTTRRSAQQGKEFPERRSNFELREVLDEFLRLTRHLARHARDLPDDELADIVRRLEWLADEVVRITTAITGAD